MSKNQFTGTAMQPQRNRKFCQFNKDQYCNRSNGQQKPSCDVGMHLTLCAYKVLQLSKQFRCVSENLVYLPMAVIIMTIANGMFLTFYGMHSKDSIISNNI